MVVTVVRVVAVPTFRSLRGETSVLVLVLVLVLVVDDDDDNPQLTLAQHLG